MEIAGDDAMEQRDEQTDADRFEECDADRDAGRNRQMQRPDPRAHEKIPQQRQCRDKAGAHRENEYYMTWYSRPGHVERRSISPRGGLTD